MKLPKRETPSRLRSDVAEALRLSLDQVALNFFFFITLKPRVE